MNARPDGADAPRAEGTKHIRVVGRFSWTRFGWRWTRGLPLRTLRQARPTPSGASPVANMVMPNSWITRAKPRGAEGPKPLRPSMGWVEMNLRRLRWTIAARSVRPDRTVGAAGPLSDALSVLNPAESAAQFLVLAAREDRGKRALTRHRRSRGSKTKKPPLSPETHLVFHSICQPSSGLG
jgi:hypothetical protein